MLFAAASSSNDTTFSIPILIVAAGVALGWLVIVALLAAARHVPNIKAAGGVADLPAESPAVAGMLAGDFVVPAETAPAILLDLAARNVVDLEEVQPGKTICRVRRAHDEALTDYEEQVLDAIEGKAIDGVVPTEALTTGTEDASKGWHRQLAKKIIADAQTRGMTKDRWPKGFVATLGLTVFAAPGLVYLASAVGGESDEKPILAGVAGGIAVVGFLLGAMIAGRMSQSLAQLPTAAGIPVAARVRGLEEHLRENESLSDLPPAAVTIWGRHFAYAAAFGAAPVAVARLPMGAEDDHRAWSRFGGRWRQVRVRYPRFLPPAWGRHPLSAIATTLLVIAISGAAIYGLAVVADADRDASITKEQWDTLVTVARVAMVPFVLAIAWSLWVLVRATPDLWKTRTVTGEIVRDRRFVRSQDNNRVRYHYYLAVDNGTQAKIAAWRMREDLWSERDQGETVRAEITPNLRYVRSMEMAPAAD